SAANTRARSRPAASSRASPKASAGRISTSPDRRGTTAERVPQRGGRYSCSCSILSIARRIDRKKRGGVTFAGLRPTEKGAEAFLVALSGDKTSCGKKYLRPLFLKKYLRPFFSPSPL